MEKLFVIGDEKEFDSTFRYMSSFDRSVGITYDELFSGNGVIATDAPTLLCFPYGLWEEKVETGDMLYGGSAFGKLIRKLTEEIQDRLEIRLPDARYVNHPLTIIRERDKLYAKRVLSSHGISVAQDIEKSLDAIMEELANGEAVYVKVRYGSMGKGITYLSQDKWTTNFRYENGLIGNHEDDNSWSEIDITGNTDFLKRLLEEDVIVERAVRNSKTNGLKFDMRVRVVFGEADSDFAYGRATHTNSITNISQGAKIITLDRMKEFVPQESIFEGIDIIRRSSGILDINYAGGDLLFEGRNFDPVFLEINSFPGPRNPRIFFPKLYNAIRINLFHERPNHRPREQVYRPPSEIIL